VNSDIFQSCVIVGLRGVLTFGVFFYGSHFFALAEVGLLAQVFAYIFVMTAVFDSGYSFLLLRDTKKNGKEVLSEIANHKLLVNSMLLFFTISSIHIFTNDFVQIYVIATLISLTISFQNFFGVYCRSFKKYDAESSSLGIQVLMLLFLAHMFHGEMGVDNALIIILTVRLVGIFYLYFRLKDQLVLSLKRFSYYLKNTATYGLVVIFSTLYFQVDTIIIGRFGSIEDAGFHQNAVRLAVIGMMIMEVTNQVFQPALVDKYINDRQSFSEYQRQIQRFFAAFSLLICVFLIFFSIPLLELIYGTEYLGLDRFVPFVCFIFMLRTFGLTVSLPMSLDANAWPRIVCVFLASLISISLNLIFIGVLDYQWSSAFYISIAVHILVNSCYVLFAKYKSEISLDFTPLVLSLGVVVVLANIPEIGVLYLFTGLVAAVLSISYFIKIKAHDY